MPRRSEVDAVEIWPLLQNVLLTEWHGDPERIYYRIVGTALVAAMGFEVRGKWLTEIYRDQAVIDRTLGLYRPVAAARIPAFGRAEGNALRYGAEAFEWVICPLSDDGETVTHFLGLEDYVSHRRDHGGIT
jgi:hypothetical protein